MTQQQKKASVRASEEYLAQLQNLDKEIGKKTVTFKFNLTIRFGLLSGVFGASMILAYILWIGIPGNSATQDEKRNFLDFLLKTIGTSAAITSALYVGENIRNQTKQRVLENAHRLAEKEEERERDKALGLVEREEEKRLKEEEKKAEENARKLERALHYIELWNDPSFCAVKRVISKFRQVIENMPEERHPQLVKQAIDQDKILEQKVKDLLNFLEDVGYAYRKELVDKQTIEDYFSYIFYSYNRIFLMYINERQIKSRDLYCNFLAANEMFGYKPTPRL